MPPTPPISGQGWFLWRNMKNYPRSFVEATGGASRGPRKDLSVRRYQYTITTYMEYDTIEGSVEAENMVEAERLVNAKADAITEKNPDLRAYPTWIYTEDGEELSG